MSHGPYEDSEIVLFIDFASFLQKSLQLTFYWISESGEYGLPKTINFLTTFRTEKHEIFRFQKHDFHATKTTIFLGLISASVYTDTKYLTCFYTFLHKITSFVKKFIGFLHKIPKFQNQHHFYLLRIYRFSSFLDHFQEILDIFRPSKSMKIYIDALFLNAKNQI